MRVILLIIIGFSLVGCMNTPIKPKKKREVKIEKKREIKPIVKIVIDKKTGLIWQDDNDAKSVKKDWKNAKKYCSNLEIKGYTDWYLPSHEQLLTITDKSKVYPAIKEKFHNVSYSNKSCYLSSSSYTPKSTIAWGVRFEDGRSERVSKTSKGYVRCVRLGKK